MIELDVRLTKDGQVVVFHDPDLQRLTGLSKTIAEVDYDQLPPLSQTVPIDTIPG
jgi:glycerophosphoryl diester phosphodiesterase